MKFYKLRAREIEQRLEPLLCIWKLWTIAPIRVLPTLQKITSVLEETMGTAKAQLRNTYNIKNKAWIPIILRVVSN